MSYAAVPYTSLPYPRTHPDHLAAMARLRGVRAPDPERACVLEIGCGSGGNLLPMAAHLPDARFVGIDLSAEELARAPLVPPNATLRVGDGAVADGAFDYVIAHGVWSWVPPPTRRALLTAIRRVLTPDGVAFVSYNVLPGWHLRGAVRDLLRRHTRDRAPAEALAAAGALLQHLDRTAPRAGAWRAVLDEERLRLGAADAGYLFHELLEPENHPIAFEDFVAETRAAGLDFLCEADPLAHPTAGVRRALAPLVGDDPIAVEQALDWSRGRSFRCSLLVRDDVVRGPLEREGWFVDSRLAVRGEAFFVDDSPVEIAPALAEDLARASATHPEAWPLARLDDAHVALFEAGAVALRPRRYGLRPDGAPTALTRATAAVARWVANLRHEPVEVDAALRAALADPAAHRPFLHARALLG